VDQRTALRLARLVLTLLAVLLAAFPLFVLLDLADGGTGFGLCPDGVRTCRNPYTAAPELTIMLTLGLFAVLGGLRVATHLEKRGRTRRPTVGH
jgi:hypothetical protein